jgi:hypothetical protein
MLVEDFGIREFNDDTETFRKDSILPEGIFPFISLVF